MSTDTESRSTDRTAASQAARVQRDIDPALTPPAARTRIAETGEVADLADGTVVSTPIPTGTPAAAAGSDSEGLTPLFKASEAQRFRDVWDSVQVGFVDDPKGAVQQADELVSLVMRSLGESFASERSRLEGRARTEQASTEDLRVALRLYRSFLQRLLAF